MRGRGGLVLVISCTQHSGMTVQDARGNHHAKNGRFTQKPLGEAPDLDSPFSLETPNQPQESTLQTLLIEARQLLSGLGDNPSVERATLARRAVQHVGSQVVALAEQNHVPGDGPAFARDVYVQLQKLRPMGCALNLTNTGSRSEHVRVAMGFIEDACKLFPAAWKSEHPVQVKNTRGKSISGGRRVVGYYQHRHVQMKPTSYTDRKRVVVGVGGAEAYARRFKDSPYLDVEIVDGNTVEVREFEVHHPYWGQSEYEAKPPRGQGWQWWQEPDSGSGYWRRVKRHAGVQVRSEFGIMNVTDSDATAAHEIGHLWQHEKPVISVLEKNYYEEREALVGDSGAARGRERGVTVNYSVFPAAPYMSTRYGDRSFEILSVGVESVFYGKNNFLYADPQTQSLIVGMLATVD